MKILLATFALLITTSISTPIYAQDHAKHEAELPVGETKKKAEKNVKTNGKISTAGCETASGKTLAENDFGYADCIKQIGMKKKK